MSSRHYPSAPLLGACTAIWRNGRILLAKRSVDPNAGTWAMPGGLVETGERLEQAAIREVREETSLEMSNLIFNRFHEIILRDPENRVERHFVLAMFVGISAEGEAIAGDDAAAVEWFTLDQLPELPLTGKTDVFVRESLGLLPRLASGDISV
ncbi:MAG: NUDIX hydrolase [Rhizobiaceae bacterium]